MRCHSYWVSSETVRPLVRYISLRSNKSPSTTVSGVNVYFMPLDHVPIIHSGGDNPDVFLAEHPLSNTKTAIPRTTITSVLLTIKLITVDHFTSLLACLSSANPWGLRRSIVYYGILRKTPLFLVFLRWRLILADLVYPLAVTYLSSLELLQA